MPLRSLLPALLVLPGTLLAQQGDKPGEEQAPPPAHIVVPPAPALSVEEALKTFKLAPGFRIEVVASDPLVVDPVAMNIGPDGRLWVVEMRGYMPNVDGTGEDAPVGTIAVLEDVDGDGRMDKRTEFAGGLVLPRAIALVADGALVAEPPRLWFLRDTDGDGRADQKTEVASDYGDPRNPEHSANGLYWAMDNWLYNAKHSVRFRYDQGKWTRDNNTIARGQWGVTQDDVGRIYYNTNSDALRVDALPDEYLRRNPNLPAPRSVNTELARPADISVWPGRVTTGVNRGYKILRDDGTLPSVTAASGPVIYRGTLFPEEFRGNAFVPEPSANLVKRLVIDERNGALSSRNAYYRTEFLTSTDERFRPVNLYNGPEGALYILDMYRGVLQHRIFVTSYLRKQIEARGLEQPRGLGRIYRVVPDTAPRALAAKPALATASAPELVQALENDSGWWRDTAQRLLVERADPASLEPLRTLANSGKNPLARLHALWTLHGIGALDQATVERSLGDADPRVCAAAVRLSEPWLKPDNGALVKKVAALITRPEANVRLQLALTLSGLAEPSAEAAIQTLITAGNGQAYLDEAVASGLAGRELEFLEKLRGLAKDQPENPGINTLAATLVATVLKGADTAAAERIFAWIADPGPWRLTVLAGLERYVPGGNRTVTLPTEPKQLVALAAVADVPEAAQAAELLKNIRWKGQAVPANTTGGVEALTEEQRVLFEKGRINYAVCAGCHQPDGQGMSGLAPALVGSRWVKAPPGAMARIVLKGKEQPGQAMPPLGSLDDETIASVMTYVRRSWGHEASPVSAAEVAKVRQAVAQRDEPWTDEELEAFLH